MQDEKFTKADIIDEIYVKSGLSRQDIKLVFDMIFSEIKEALVSGKKIELRGVGTFELRIRTGRNKARNPRTGETVQSYPHRVVIFRPGQDLKRSVWEIKEESLSKDFSGSLLVKKNESSSGTDTIE
ncbi:MAG: integration host factor subunit beta [Spirochaetaceae bacterium]|jgi:integration host factor subunit beta|nr:integration host factor subunit beta [Spirochaetaceae bacterium]